MKFRGGINGRVAIAPGAACLKWNTAPETKVRVVFTYWGDVKKELPAELQPTLGDQATTPYLLADDAAHAKKLTAAIKTWLTARHPDLTQKKSKELTRFMSGKQSYWVAAYPEREHDFVIEAMLKNGTTRWNIGGDPKHASITWQGATSGDVDVHIADDEVRFQSNDPYAEYAEPAQKHGTLEFDDGLLASISLDNTFANLRDPVSTPAELRALAKKPAVLKGKKGEEGDAFVAKIAKGAYEVESGPDVAAKLRWLTLKRV